MKFEIASLPVHEVVPGYHGRFVHTERTTIAYWEVEEGAAIPIHAHLHEQTTQILEGSFELTVDGHTEVYGPGWIGVIPPHVPHGGRAITTCRILDTFSPVREDYRR